MNWRDLQILFSDNHLLVVDKPAGLPVQADASGDPDLLSLAKLWVGHHFAKPGAVYLGLVHRLDRPARGVVVLARTSKAAARLSTQFRERTAHKVYAAIVLGRPHPAQAQCEDWLAPSEGSTRIAAQGVGQQARLEYRTLGQYGALSQLEIELETGRKHQIRVQLASRGWPIQGDLRYGAAVPLPDKGIALWAKSLTLDHPTLATRLTFDAPTPPGWPWQLQDQHGR